MLADALGLSEKQRQELAATVARGNLQAIPALDATSTPGNNLPLTPTQFLGRERELMELRTLLDNERLVTLTGIGGIGKTRAALRAASEFLGRKDDGVCFVNLAPLGDPTLVPNAVATALRIPLSGERPIAQTLLAALRGRHCLIVLDKCEHVVAAAAELANALVLTCPRVNLLVTARGNRKGTGCGKRIALTSAERFGAARCLSRSRLSRRPPVFHPVTFAGDRDHVSVMN